MLPPTAKACSVGFGGTHIHLITCCNEGVLDNDVLTCGLFWLDIMFSETFKQQAIAYVFPSINNTCYHHCTPQQLPAQQQPHKNVVDISSGSDEDAQQHHQYLHWSLCRLRGVEDQSNTNNVLPISCAHSSLCGHHHGWGGHMVEVVHMCVACNKLISMQILHYCFSVPFESNSLSAKVRCDW